MSWIKRLREPGEFEEQLDKEILFHLDQRTEDLIAAGHTREEASRLARLKLGGVAQIKEECREAHGFTWIADIVSDARYGFRTLLRKPAFAAIALLTLALGTGATTLFFALMNGVVFSPFPYHDPSRLVALHEQTDWSTPLGNIWGFTYPNYLDCRHDASSLDMSVWRPEAGTLSRPGAAEYVQGVAISAGMFRLLGLAVSRGREFSDDDDRAGAPPVAIINDTLWKRHFGSANSAIGSQIVFDGKPYTVVGIAPAGFRLNDFEEQLMTPIGQDAPAVLQNRQAHGFRVWARLKPGAALTEAQTELNVVSKRLSAGYPDSNKGRFFIAEPLRPALGETRSTLWLLFGAGTVVLLIACANIASLLLARSVSREREFGIRTALGAGRARIARQCLVESSVLAVIGGALGVLFAVFSLRPFELVWPGRLPRIEEVRIDWHVLLFGLAVSLVSGLIFGCFPALRAPLGAPNRALRAGGRALSGNVHRLQSVFVVTQIGLATVLVASAGIMADTLIRLSALDPGFDRKNVLTARAALSPAILANPDRTKAVWNEVLDRARALPEVKAAALVDTVPMRLGNNQIYYSLAPTPPPESQRPIVLANSVTPDYLNVSGLHLRSGRFISDADRKGAQSIAVIDDVMAQHAFHGENPIGKHVWIGLGADPVTVVGVVGHVNQFGLAADEQASVRAQLYYPFAQVPDNLVRRWSELMSIAVRTRVDPLRAVAPLTGVLRGVSSDQVLYDIHTFEELSSASVARHQFMLIVFSVYAGLALLLACIAIYGVLSYVSNLRVPEIGMRIAVGASAHNVTWLILKQSLVVALLGLAVGVPAAIAAGRMIAHFTEGVQAVNPATIGLTILPIAMAALLAGYVPARRAAAIDPAVALRRE